MKKLLFILLFPVSVYAQRGTCEPVITISEWVDIGDIHTSNNNWAVSEWELQVNYNEQVFNVYLAPSRCPAPDTLYQYRINKDNGRRQQRIKTVAYEFMPAAKTEYEIIEEKFDK